MPKWPRALPVAVLSLLVSNGACLPAQVRAVGQRSERITTRVFHFESKPTFTFTVQYAITYGAPVWKERIATALAAGEGKAARFRLGKDFWTTLDTNSDLVIGGVRQDHRRHCHSDGPSRDGEGALRAGDRAGSGQA